MEKLAGYELSLHSYTYVHKNLTDLHLPEISLSVPTLDETILINSPDINETRRIVVETIEPGSRFEISRVDGRPLQVKEASTDEYKASVYGRELFNEPIRHLALTSLNHFAWSTNVEEDNIADTAMMREFIGILSSFARMKQTKLLDN